MSVPDNTELTAANHERIVTSAEIQNLIYVIRGKQVMLDSDLAQLYQVETKVLNQAVKRNIARFPANFRFQLTVDEYENLKSQFVTSSCETNNSHGGRRKLPFAFTEQGIAMLSAVLRSDTAIQVSIRIMETFVEMRKYLAKSTLLLEKVNRLETRQLASELHRSEFEAKTEQRFAQVFEYIAAHEETNQKIFFDGQIFDAFSLIIELVQRAENSIVLIDGYVDVETLNILAKKKENVHVLIYTLPSSRITAKDIEKFNAQYPRLEIRRTTVFHDRFLLLDDNDGYHIGASVKDAGKKCFGINRIDDVGVIQNILRRAELTG